MVTPTNVQDVHGESQTFSVSIHIVGHPDGGRITLGVFRQPADMETEVKGDKHSSGMKVSVKKEAFETLNPDL